jgi:hypothetical protein
MFLGIDESNHGRIPEIFAGVYSTKEADIKNIQSKPKFKKIRRHADLEDVVKGRKFKFVVFEDKFLDYMDKNFLVTIATAELINDEKMIDSLIIDGTHHKQEAINSIYELISPEYKERRVNEFLKCIPDADRRTRIVNMADGIAYKLFKYYDQFKSITDAKTYDKYRIIPDLNKYKEFFKK